MKAKDVVVGCKVPVLTVIDGEAFYRKAEVLATRETPKGARDFYVHYIDFNKRLDEWVPDDRLLLKDPDAIELPKKKKASKPPRDSEARAAPVEEEEKKKGEGGIRVDVISDEIYKVKNVQKVEMGEYIVNAWYFSPYPIDFANSEKIVLCEYCLFYFEESSQLDRHRAACAWKRPPGTQIYRKDGVSFFELDGAVHRNYCRNLCLLSKLFLDHKTLYYDIDVFLFYAMCTYEPGAPEPEREYKIVGYFSKEKESLHGYNVACVLVLPQYQRRGFGRLLIDFSYLLSKRERIAASPEKPLSDLGLLSYRQYWMEKITDILVHSKSISINDIRDMSSITTDDIVHTLRAQNMLMFYNGVPCFVIRDKVLAKYEKSLGGAKLDAEYLQWEPKY